MPSGPGTAPSAAPAGASVDLLGARVRWTGRAEGDLRPAEPDGGGRLLALAGRPVSWLRQVHGARVVVVHGAGPVEGEEGDALVAGSPRGALAVLTADCAPLALASPEGVLAAVHAGWAGLLAGVVPAAVGAMRAMGATRIEAALGPCIRAECYEFGPADLARVADALGAAVEGVSSAGRPSLDLPAAVGSALAAAGATLVADAGVCTACEAGRYYSYRARGEAERQAMLLWRAA